MTTFVTEAGRFYLPNGEAFYTVPNKSKPGESRPATVRDALKAGAEPSVTTVGKAVAAPGLTHYFIESAMDSVLALQRTEGESIEEFKARALRDSQEKGKQARERGTDIHGAIELHLCGKPYDSRFSPHIENVRAALSAKGVDIYSGKPERSFCLPGYFAGKVDLHGDGWVVDFKGVDDAKLGGRMGWPEHVRQLSAYAYGLGMPSARLLNVFVGRAEGGAQVREWTPEEAAKGLAEFLAILRFYRIQAGFPVEQLAQAA